SGAVRNCSGWLRTASYSARETRTISLQRSSAHSHRNGIRSLTSCLIAASRMCSFASRKTASFRAARSSGTSDTTGFLRSVLRFGRRSARPLQPRAEAALDVTAAPRLAERSADAPVLDDDERRDPVHAEALEELGVFLLGDAMQHEGLVIPAALQDLGEET